MKLPNAENAIIAEEKLRYYLLNPDHLRGGSKAKLLLSMGYTAADWRKLESDLRAEHLWSEVIDRADSPCGKRFEIVAPITGPSGDTVLFRSIWQIDLGTNRPRLVTMYPE